MFLALICTASVVLVSYLCLKKLSNLIGPAEFQVSLPIAGTLCLRIRWNSQNLDQYRIYPTNFQIDKNWSYKSIILEKTKAAFGFSIVGGTENGYGNSCVSISKISEGGSAAKDGRLNVENIIVQIDDLNFENISHIAAVAKLSGAGKLVRICIKRKIKNEIDAYSLEQALTEDRTN